MEALKRKRTQFRREFTVTADILDKALTAKEEIFVENRFATLSDCAEELFRCEVAIRDLWCQVDNFDEIAYQEDQDKALQYKTRWAQLKTSYNNFSKSNKNSDGDNNSLVSAKSSIKSHSHERKIKMPKLEITKFDGEVKKWLLFWGQFKKIDEDPDINNSDKYQYLLQSMEPNSNARQLVESYPPCGENYTKALEALRSRFARDDILIETYVRGLLALMQEKGQKPSNTKELSVLYDSLQMHLQALETLGVTKDKYASILFPMVESALPDDVLRAWNRYRADGKSNNDLSKLVDFLRQEVESEERILLAHQGTMNSTSQPKTPTCCFVSETKPERRNNSLICIWCDKDTHCSVECHKAARMSLQQRIEHVKTKKACTICLKQNHLARKCKSFPKCLFCKKRHVTILCPDIDEQCSSKVTDEPAKASSLHCDMKSTTLLQTIVVQVVSNNKRKVVRARALIDSGAQRSYIRKDLVEELHLRPTRKEFITHCLFGGKEESREERQIYDICVKNLANDFIYQMSVVEQTNICSFLPKIRSTEIIRQLEQNKIVLTETTDSPTDVSLLIGADYSGILMTGDIIQVTSGLTAIRTKMGWTIQGPITGIYSSLVSMTTTLNCLSETDISNLWNLEMLGTEHSAEQDSKIVNNEVIQDFENTIAVNEERRYEVCLPWLDVPRPQSNYVIAKKRLNSTTNRLHQLGIVWDIQEDSLRCNADLLENIDGKLSKRTLLSVMQKVFDPIGITCPTTIIPRMLIQKSWRIKLTWDEELPTDLAAEAKAWLDQAHLINNCIIPRRLSTLLLDESENSLHILCDASKDAYAVCVFLRTECNVYVKLSLVQAKSRNREALMNCPEYHWIDSRVVLTWIKGNGDWSVFVTNRGLNKVEGTSLNARAKYCQVLREEFRRRFKSEYISTLVQPRKMASQRGLKIGDAVIIENDDRRRLNWPLVIVTEVLPRKNKIPRVARIRTATGEKVRPAQRLYPCEVAADEFSSPDQPGSSNCDIEHRVTDSKIKDARRGRSQIAFWASFKVS